MMWEGSTKEVVMKNLAIFGLTFALSFGGGYLYFTNSSSEAQQAAQPAASQTQQQAVAAQPTATASAEGEIFVKRGCNACHAVEALGVQGGATGPDLSKAFVNVKDKHGIPIEQFLKKPTSAVMSGVLGGKPLTDDELKAVLAALKAASEK